MAAEKVDIKFRKVSTAMWGDKKFRSLSRPQPNAQSLWQWLITGPRSTQIPGVIIGNLAVLAGEIGWSPEDFAKAFEEVFAKGMAKADFEAGFVFLPRACIHNKPTSPNVIRSWRGTWDDVPECELKHEAWRVLKAFAKGWGEGWTKAFGEACAHPSPNQEKEQEQEQERDQEGEQEQDQEQERAREPSPLKAAAGGGHDGSGEDVSGTGSPPEDPSPKKRGAAAERRNGSFDDILDAVSKVLTAGWAKPGEYSRIGQLAHVSALQAEVAVRQLRDRGRLPGAAA